MIRSIIAVVSLILAAQTPIRVPEPIRVPLPTRLPERPTATAADRPTTVSRIIGRVNLHQTGLPVQGLTVWAFRKGYNEEGIPVSTRASSAVTDEHGRYYIPLTNAGRYYVMSAVNLSDSLAATFYPGSLDESLAKPIDVLSGKDATGVDFEVRQARAVSISGRLVDGLGRRLPHMDWVWLARRPPTLPLGGVGSGGGWRARLENRDRYQLEHVLPGMYYLCAYRFDDEFHRADTIVPILVGDEDINIDLVSERSYDVTGRFIFEGPRITVGPPESPIRVAASLVDDPSRLVSTATQHARIRRDGTFGFMPLPAGHFRFSVLGVPAPYYVKSARSGSIDVLQDGLTLGTDSLLSVQIVISNNGGRVVGGVVNGTGQPVPLAHVVLTPNRTGVLRPDLYKLETSDIDGQFSIAGVAPGDYRIYAWEQLEQGAYFDPEFMSRFEGRGTPVQVTAGSVSNVKLTRMDNRP
jgi:hypothetical protein